MDLNAYLTLLARRWRTILAATALGLLAAFGLTALMTPQYTAATRVHFAVRGGESVSELAQGSTFTESQMSSYVEAVRSDLVLEPVVEDLGLAVGTRALAEVIDVTAPEGTMVLEIAVTDPDATHAAELANAVAAELARAAAVLTPAPSDGSEPVVATVLTRAYVPDSPTSPRLAAILALGGVLGLLVGVAWAVVRRLTDTRVRSAEDVAELTDVPVIGTVAFEQAASRAFVDDDPTGALAEAIRQLRTNLTFVHRGDDARSLVVTSSVAGEGKTVTAINLAIAMGNAGARVILVDADLRRPAVASYLGLEGRAGLTTVLIGAAELSEVVQTWHRGAVDVLVSGVIPPNPSELLGSTEMTTLLAELTGAYDLVVLDSPPVLPVTDAAVLSTLAGGTVLVAGADRVHRAQLRESLETLVRVGARLRGIALNKVSVKNRGGYYAYQPLADRSDVGGRGRARARGGAHGVEQPGVGGPEGTDVVRPRPADRRPVRD